MTADAVIAQQGTLNKEKTHSEAPEQDPSVRSPTDAKAFLCMANKSVRKVKLKDILNLAQIMYAENGSHEDDEAIILTGVVVLKRVKSKEYPNTIMGVVSQEGQYSTYADGSFWCTPDERCIEIAEELLRFNLADNYPDNLLFQAEFEQGATVYKKLGYEYFCLK